MEETEKACKNCRWAREYYFIFYTHLKRTDKYDCLRDGMTKKDKNYFLKHGGCEKWEPDTVAKEKMENNIERAIFNMERELKDIAAILAADKKD